MAGKHIVSAACLLLLVTLAQAQSNSPPIFGSNSFYSYEIPEDYPVETNLPTGENNTNVISATDSDGDSISFTIPFGSINSDKFQIVPLVNGTNMAALQIRSGAILDRDTLPPLQFTLSLIVEASDGTESAEANVLIILLDVNDNTPSITNLPSTITVPEDQIVGSIIFTVDATDEDSGRNELINYELQMPSTFTIDENNGEVALEQALDFDVGPQMYTLTVTATDNGAVPRTTFGILTILVKDVNDLPPVFDPDVAFVDVTIHENLTMGDTVYEVNAQDGDRDINDNITYSIVPGNDLVNGTNIFIIDNETGVISVNIDILDRETFSEHDLSVQATEVDDTTKMTTLSVRIEVLDVNDNSPFFSAVFYTGNISETATNGSLAATVMAEDPDLGVNAEFDFHLEATGNMTEPLPFIIDNVGGIGRILKNSSLDYERRQSYIFRVVATERGTAERRNATALVEVGVTNENDNSPVFQNGSYSVTVPEEASPGLFVAQIIATDMDLGDFGRVQYALIGGGDMAMFNITSDTGVVMTDAMLDYEIIMDYIITVEAYDFAGTNTRRTQVTLIVEVQNLNDNVPMFITGVPGVPTANVTEEQAPGVEVYEIMVEDLDGDLNELVFEITGGNDLGFFALKPDEPNILITNQVLDYDVSNSTLRNFIIQIEVNDSFYAPSLYVSVYITDINDNDPEFDNASYAFDVAEGTTSGYLVGTVTAEDIDSGLFGSVEYSLSGDGTATFRMNATSGEIRTVGMLNREIVGSYMLTVTATDLDPDPTAQRTSTAPIIITVLDENDNSPMFDESTYRFEVTENTAILASDVRVRATDADIGLNGNIIYDIVSGNRNSTFEIDMIGGEIRRNPFNQIDREFESQYELLIVARDGGIPERNDTTLVIIVILDENDVIPQFPEITYNVTIAENLRVGNIVLNVVANDTDAGINGLLRYSIAAPTSGGADLFVIQENTGTVLSSGTFDRETFAGPYTFEVLAEDSGTLIQNTGTTTVIIYIEDVNDNNPLFEFNSYTATVPETSNASSVIRMFVTQVTATDLDQRDTPNSEIEYNITDVFVTNRVEGSTDNVPPMNHFIINTTTGAIYTDINLDYEVIRSYRLVVEAKDNGSPPESSSVFVTVDVSDINDNVPVFTRPYYTLSIPENTPVNSRFTETKATDLDSGAFGQLTYSISSVFGEPLAGVITIDGSNGDLNLAASLDYETTNLYFFEIQANDSSNIGVANVTIMVLDINDHTPTFNMTTQDVAFEEGDYMDAPMIILTLSAEDLDSGSLGNVTYTIISGNDDGVFEIDLTSGEVFVSEEVDRELVDTYTITVQAQDGGEPSRTSTIDVVVTVLDVNDLAPTFLELDYNGTVQEELGPGEIIVQVVAEDGDEGENGRVIYSIEDPFQRMNFTVNNVTGVISTARAFDYEDLTSYVFTVRARDNDDNVTSRRYRDVQVIVTIVDANDNSPIFELVTVPLPLLRSEDTPVGSSIITVMATDDDSLPNAQIEYQISNGEGRFAILTNGTIIIANSLDREITSEYNLTVIATDGMRMDTVYISIIVEDINDVVPQFLQDSYTILVNENHPTSTSILEVIVIDYDTEDRGEVSIAITDGNQEDRFEIQTVSVPNSARWTGIINVKQDLNYEQTNAYLLIVTATDTDPPNHSSMANVTITILDVNDNRPAFSALQYNFPVPEVTPPGSPIGTVVATDSDGGLFGMLVYSITAESLVDPIIATTFSINDSTGVITLLRAVNFEQMPNMFMFDVLAQDQSSSPLNSSVTIMVGVQDVNEFSPEFDREIYEGSVMEMSPNTQFVVRVNATERDSGSGLGIMYSFVTVSTSEFAINPNTGIITVSPMLDREEISQYILTVQATDLGGLGGLAGFAQVVVKITDVNDNSPTFSHTAFTYLLPENSPPGTPLSPLLTATDTDEGVNAVITYIISGGPFVVNPISGIIEVESGSDLDREVLPTYSLTLTAEDGGSVTMSSSIDITVTLTDVNDNNPDFGLGPFTASVPENSPDGTPVRSIQASDADLNGISYTIQSGDDILAKFRIHPTLGLIETTDVPLDRETTDTYVLVVLATDDGNPLRSTPVQVTVSVEDTNDYEPEFVGGPFNFVTREASMLRVLVDTIAANDADAGINAEVRFAIIAGNADGSFFIDDITGELFAEPNRIDFESQQEYNLRITATDQAANAASRLTATAMVSVMVEDFNDNRPEFSETSYSVSVREDADIGDIVVIIRATDADSGINGVVSYSILGTVGAFSINSTSGVVVVSGGLDRETVPRYELTVQAIDGGTDPLAMTVPLIIDIINTNDNSPLFDRTFYTAAIEEDRPVNTTVRIITANDPDGTASMYSILSGNPRGYFKIDPVSGAVQIATSLDRETVAVSDIVILAIDPGNMNGTTILQVTILDVNDNAPMFTEVEYFAEVPENSLQGTQILPIVNGTTSRIEAIDADGPGENSRVLYSLQGVNADLFNIDFNTGIVTVARGSSLDREAIPELTIQVVAIDAVDQGPLTSMVDLTITITDVNDVAPLFSRPFGYAVTIQENAVPGTTLDLNIETEDADSGAGGMVVYSINSADPFASRDIFYINETTGVITVVGVLDREFRTVVTLSISAEDMGNPVLGSVVNVQVTVTDMNDNSPTFDREDYTITVQEFLPIGASVLQISATDRDVSFNGLVSYSIDRMDGPFTINENTGVITTTTPLDYENDNFYNFSVKACDAGMPVMCSSTDVLIFVVDFNDEVPTFDLPRYQVDINDSYSTGDVILQPVAIDRDSGRNAELIYFLEDEVSGFFEVDRINGQISLTQDVNSSSINEIYTFLIVAMDGGSPILSGSAEIVVRVVNASEVPFYFTMSYEYFEVLENSGVSFIELSLQPTTLPSIVLTLNPMLVGFSVVGGGILLPDFDREQRELYTMVVQATISGESDVAYGTVTIRVVDVNDNPPMFMPNIYYFTINENGTAPQLLGRVVATDRDEGSNANITFRIDPNSDLAMAFSIDAGGNITTVRPLDREIVDEYNLVIFADDPNAGNRQQASVRVTVEDINDVTPTCSMSTYPVEILENSPIGLRVLTVEATDNDSGENAVVSFSITAGNIGVFRIDGVTGEVVTTTTIDFEDVRSYELTVQVADNGVPQRSSSCMVGITVLDFNDCPPEFENPPDSFSVQENSNVGSVIVEYTVMDCDSGLNGENGTRFSIIAGNNDGFFSIGELSGTVTTTAELDREVQASYLLSIQARDSAGVNTLSSITQISVIVIDVNDNNPVFLNPPVSLNIHEGEDTEQVFLTITATDADEGSNGEVTYSLDGGQDVFIINSGTGGISLGRSLDRESVDNYTLTVFARDRGTDSRSSNTTISVTVDDDNDNSPIILNIISGVTIRNISESADIAAEVYIVSATDEDIGLNGDILFSLDDPTMPFTISPTTGVITVSRSLDYEIQREYSIVVRAIDQGIVRKLTGLATLTVEVLDENDNPPEFQQTMYTAELEENIDSQTVATVTALDADQTNSPNAIIVYSIIEDSSNIFQIDSSTGVISNNVALDREAVQQYSLTVLASNALSHNPLNSTVVVEITILDMNDEIPQFERSTYGMTISELTSVGTQLLDITATDADEINNPNSEIIYILSRLDNNPFHIDQNTGELTVQSSLDYETTPNFNLTVTAEDKGIPTQVNMTTIRITLTDVNDRAPAFVQPIYTAAISEAQTSFPAVIVSLEYTDEDTEDNRDSTIEIISGDPTSLFLVNTAPSDLTGEVLLRAQLDYETLTSYTLTLRVTNNVASPGELCNGQSTPCYLSGTAQLVVTVLDVNDNPPRFTERQYSAEVSTTVNAGSSVITVMADDADSDEFGTVSYRFREASDLFRIDESSGTIFTQRGLGNLDGLQVTLVVIASDSAGANSLSDAVNVSVLLLNDFQRVRIIFGSNQSVISGKQDFIVSALQNISGLVIVLEPNTGIAIGEPSTRTNFTFHAIDTTTNTIVDYYEFLRSIQDREDELFELLRECMIIEIVPAAGPAVYPGALDTATIVIIVLCGFLVIGALLLLFLSLRQRYLALHDARSRLLADVFYGTPGTSDIENVPQQEIQLEQMKGPRQNPMFVHPYDNWGGVDTSGAESIGESSLKRDNPLYESQEIRMEMFADVSDEETDGEVDDAELLAAALKEDEELEDNSVTAI